MGLLNKKSLVFSFLQKLELFLYRQARLIVVVTNTFKDVLVNRGIEPSKICVVTNGIDTTLFNACAKEDVLVNNLGLKDKFVVGYIGTVGMAHGLDVIVDAAEILSKNKLSENICFLVLGNGAERKRLLLRAQRLKLKNIIFCDSVPKREVVGYWSLLDLSLIHLKRAKLFEA